tara:strand:- start:69 stop:1562 length:1494 start_codon:yes stop_codon:yes gene_type:complete
MALAISALKYDYVSIQNPNSENSSIDLTNHLVQTEYFEDLLSPVITMQMQIRSEFNYVSNVPIRGGEMIAFSANVGGKQLKFGDLDKKGNIIPNTGELYVYKLSDLSTPSQAQDFTLHITTLEFIKNETSRCQKKFKPLSIDKHVKNILTDVMKVNPDKVLTKNIEESLNTYTFIGNNRKPFYTINWLCPKAVGKSKTPSAKGVSGIETNSGSNNAQGKGTAGFLFYENQEGFNFKSIESLVSSTKLDNNEKKSVFSYVYKGKGSTGNPYNLDENTNINFYYLSKSTDVRKALTVGQYGSLTIFYDSLNQTFSQIEYRLEKEIDSKLGSDDDLSTPKVQDKKLHEYNSRLYSRISDHGALGVGEKGLEASGRDPVDQAKSISRYNALFSQSLNIQVPCNTNLKVGDIINVTFPELKMGKSEDSDPSMSGNYLISRLNHHMQLNASFTSLNLIRDSHGESSAYPVDTMQSGSIIDESGDQVIPTNYKDDSIPNLPYLK